MDDVKNKQFKTFFNDFQREKSHEKEMSEKYDSNFPLKSLYDDIELNSCDEKGNSVSNVYNQLKSEDEKKWQKKKILIKYGELIKYYFFKIGISS